MRLNQRGGRGDRLCLDSLIELELGELKLGGQGRDAGVNDTDIPHDGIQLQVDFRQLLSHLLRGIFHDAKNCDDAFKRHSSRRAQCPARETAARPCKCGRGHKVLLALDCRDATTKACRHFRECHIYWRAQFMSLQEL